MMLSCKIPQGLYGPDEPVDVSFSTSGGPAKLRVTPEQLERFVAHRFKEVNEKQLGDLQFLESTAKISGYRIEIERTKGNWVKLKIMTQTGQCVYSAESKELKFCVELCRSAAPLWEQKDNKND